MRADWLNLVIYVLFACALLKGAVMLADLLKGMF
jgi:hypothetical protein